MVLKRKPPIQIARESIGARKHFKSLKVSFFYKRYHAAHKRDIKNRTPLNKEAKNKLRECREEQIQGLINAQRIGY